MIRMAALELQDAYERNKGQTLDDQSRQDHTEAHKNDLRSKRKGSAGRDTIAIAGVATNVCCESTGRDCMMRGFRTIMVSDANASFSEAEHQAALLNFITYFGDVQSTEEVVARLAVQAPAAEVA